MRPDDIPPLFTRSDDTYVFARWGRPIVPVVFGVETATLQVIKGAIEAVVTLARHKMAETDPELGANLMVFFLRDWDDLRDVPNLDGLIPDLVGLLGRLKAANANHYRAFRFEKSGAIKACFCFIRMDDALSAVPADALALTEAIQSILLWSDRAFAKSSPLGLINGTAVIRPEIAGVIRAAYDPVLPEVARDPSHALRLFARMDPSP